MATDAANDPANEIEQLYLELLRAFYEKPNRAEARKIAKRLEGLLAAQPEFADSIRAEEIRSLVAELRGNLTEAIHSRESEIRKIFELHSLTLKTPSRKFVLRQYDFSDISDRLDLLAGLYAEQGNLARAVRTLRESKHFCQSHGIPFDGEKLLREFEEQLSAQSVRKNKAMNGKRRARAG